MSTWKKNGGGPYSSASVGGRRHSRCCGRRTGAGKFSGREVGLRWRNPPRRAEAGFGAPGRDADRISPWSGAWARLRSPSRRRRRWFLRSTTSHESFTGRLARGSSFRGALFHHARSARMPNARRFRRWRCRRGCRGVRSVRTRPMHLHGPRCASCNENDDSCSSRGAVRRRRGGRESKQLFGGFSPCLCAGIETPNSGRVGHTRDLLEKLRVILSITNPYFSRWAVRSVPEPLGPDWPSSGSRADGCDLTLSDERDGATGESPPRHYAPRVPSRAPFASSFDRQHTMAPPGGRPATAKGSARDKHVTFSEPSRGERGSLRRVPTGGAGALAAASRIAAESGNAPPRGTRSGKNLVAPVSASLESLEVRRRRRRARAPPRDSKRPHSPRC